MIKKVFKWLGVAVCSIALVFGSFFITKNNTKNYLASADNVYDVDIGDPKSFDFNFSNINFVYYSNSSYSTAYSMSLNLNIVYDSFYRVNLNDFRFYSYSQIFDFSYFDYIDLYDNDFDYSLLPFFNSGAYEIRANDYNNVASQFTSVYLVIDPLFNMDFSYYNVQVSALLNILTGSYLVADTSHYKFLTYTFYDVNSHFISVSFRVSPKTPNFSDDVIVYGTDSQQYNSGYNDGLKDKQPDIYQNGFNAGYDNGFANGRTEGIISANDYSFTSLMGSVIDAPVKAVTSLLNFEILGVNLLDFALGIFSIALIVTIIRITKGG